MSDLLGDIQNGMASAGRSLISGLPAPVQNFITADNSQTRRRPISLPEYTLFIDCNERNIRFRAPLPESFGWAQSAEYTSPFREVLGDALNSNIIGKGVSALSRANGIHLVTQALTAKFWGGSRTQGITIPVVLQARYDEVEEVQKPLLNLMALTVPSLQGGNRGGVMRAPGPHFDLTKAWNELPSNTQTSTRTTVAGKPTFVVDPDSGLGGYLSGMITSRMKSISDDLSDGNITKIYNDVVNDAASAANKVDSFLRNSTRNVISFQIGRYIRLPSVVITDVQHRHDIMPVGTSSGQSTGNMMRMELSITVEPYVELVLDDFDEIFLDPRLRAYAASLVGKSSASPEQILATDGHV